MEYLIDEHLPWVSFLLHECQPDVISYRNDFVSLIGGGQIRYKRDTNQLVDSSIISMKARDTSTIVDFFKNGVPSFK
jgi:hypothetical protein